MRAAYAAREAARRHDAAVLLLSSTARQNYGQLSKRDGDEPVWQRPAYEFVGMGKESGEVEYGADNVLVMVRGDDLGPEGTEMHIGAAKVRAGQVQQGRRMAAIRLRWAAIQQGDSAP